MDHMRILGNTPSIVILTKQNCVSKVEINGPKVPKQAEAKRDRVINQQNYILQILSKQSGNQNNDMKKRILWTNSTGSSNCKRHIPLDLINKSTNKRKRKRSDSAPIPTEKSTTNWQNNGSHNNGSHNNCGPT